MSMRPVDVQMSIPRAAELSKVAQGDQQQNQMRQQELANQSQVHTDLYEKKVRNTEETEAKKVKDQKDKEKKRQQDKKQAKPKEESANEQSLTQKKSPSSGGGLDILA